MNTSKLTIFGFEGSILLVSYRGTESEENIAPGVECDEYSFADPTKDLGIIRIAAGKATPRQRVLKGDRTVEGYLKGKGRFLITRADGKTESYAIGFTGSNVKFQKDVNVGDIMQWEAANDSDLVVYEVCFPPYTDDRYQNLQ